MIIVRHPVHAPIGAEELTAALGPSDRLANIIDIPAIHIPYGTEYIDWSAAVDAQTLQIATKYEPELQSTDSPRIIYAGRAPIPLVMHLGLRLGPWHSVEALQPHHVTRSWAWDAKPHPELCVVVEGLPIRRQETAGDVVIRVSSSFVVDPAQTRTAVSGERAIAEIDIRSTPTDRDALHHPESIARVADAFRDALTAVRNNLPGASALHVFASVPLALAFQLGVRLQANIDAPHVFIYQFNPKGPVFYHKAIDLLEDAGEAAPLTHDQIKDAATLRGLWQDQCTKVAEFCASQRVERPDGRWLGAFTADDRARVVSALPPGWVDLPNAGGTPLFRAELSREPLLGPEPYAYVPRRWEWAVTDRFLVGVARTLPDEADRRLAGDLFFLHEGFHRAVHGLTEHTARGVGVHPKTIESADYQADLWAMVQAAELHKNLTPEFLDRAIRVATETMWSFTGISPRLHVLELRSANRFLNWYWQATRLRGHHDFIDSVKTLATPPTIELSGARMTLVRGRPALSLSGDVIGRIELSIWQENRVHRIGTTESCPLPDILLGFFERDGKRIQNALQGVFDSLNTQ